MTGEGHNRRSRGLRAVLALAGAPVFASAALALRALALGAVALGALAFAALHAANAGAALESPPLPPRGPSVAYVTETARSPASVWVQRVSGLQRRRLGPGEQPLIAPSGQQVAASLFGAGPSEDGPALAIYPSEEGRPTLTFLSLADVTATPLSWSPDLRYLAVYVQSTAVREIARRSGLAVIDLGTDTVKMIASGVIYGASFAPDGSDQLVYARSRSLDYEAPVNLYVAHADGSSTVAISHDGRSLNPVWGHLGIAFDRERLRRGFAPQYQIWMSAPDGAGAVRLTDVKAGKLVSGLVPLHFCTDGTRLLAEFEGQDTSEAWTVRVRARRAHRLRLHGRPLIGAGISGNGASVLVDEGSFEEPPSRGRIATMPFAGGAAKVIVAHGAQASWNG
ncbi:MAG TPA: hypothetical protein VL979_12745 [Solirubrobacteraceae bacterium]|nr:hypothetical protein [Solirubrobacteraceae bacterium]